MRRVILIATLCYLVMVIDAGLMSNYSAGVAASHWSHPAPTLAETFEPAKSHCDRSEQVVFSCTMQKSSKVLSICSSKQLNDQKSYVQYRFGQPGKIELEFPTERENSQTNFSYNRYTRPLVTYLMLQFVSNGYKYSLHQDSNAEEKPPGSSSYLVVTSPEPDAKPIEMKCRQSVIGSLMLLEDVVPKSDGTDVPNP